MNEQQIKDQIAKSIPKLSWGNIGDEIEMLFTEKR